LVFVEPAGVFQLSLGDGASLCILQASVVPFETVVVGFSCKQDVFKSWSKFVVVVDSSVQTAE